MAKIDPKAPITNDTLMEGLDHLYQRVEEMVEEKVEEKVGGLREDMNQRFEKVDERFDQQDLRFDVLERKLDHTPSRMEKLLHTSS